MTLSLNWKAVNNLSRIEELIQKWCPDGVKYVPLNTVCEIYDGTHSTPKYVNQGIRFVSVENIGNLYASEKYISEEDYSKFKITPQIGDVFMTRIGSIGVCTVVDREESLAYYVSLALLRPNSDMLNSFFLKYAIESFEGQKELYKRTLVNAVPIKVNKDDIGKILVPVPPMEVQQEIVRILDKFTVLEAGLQAELDARKKQYEYYRDELLAFSGDTEFRSIGDIAIVTKLAGFEFTEYVNYVETGKTIALRGLNVKKGKLDLTDVKYIDGSELSKLTRSKLQTGDMLFTYVGTVGEVALISEDDRFYLAPNVAMIRLNTNTVIPEFMMYYFQTNQFWSGQINKLLQSSSMKNIPMEKIRKFIIPIPAISEQQHIVEIIRKFDEIASDVKSGIPAEIKARHKQYEYYRDKLFTFKRKEA